MVELSLMSDRIPEGTTIYTSVDFMSFDDWANSRNSRQKRIEELVTPKLERDIAELSDLEATRFIHTAVAKLEAICTTAFTNIGNPPSEIPVYCILDEEPQNSSKYDLDGERGTHTGTTLIATQSLIDALCPEFDIKLVDDLQTLLQKARSAQMLGAMLISGAITPTRTLT